MHLKRYRRQTVKEALRAVREDLGPDALVLSTRTVTALGVRGLFGAKEVEITAAAETTAQTGVEMEALVAASVAALTIYDMAKAIDKDMAIADVHLVEKTKAPVE